MQNGFIHFCYDQLTQICEYGQVLPSLHAINIKKNAENIPLLVAVFTMLFLIQFEFVS